MATCKTCNAKIKWAKFDSGKNTPLDLPAVKVIVIDEKTNRAKIVSAYVPHFATCPQAAQHRKTN